MTNTSKKALLGTIFMSLLSFNGFSKDEPKLKNQSKPAQNTVVTLNTTEKVFGSVYCKRVGRYLFVANTKSTSIGMIINRSVSNDSTKMNTVKIFPSIGSAKVYRFISSSPYYVLNPDGQVQQVTRFILPIQE